MVSHSRDSPPPRRVSPVATIARCSKNDLHALKRTPNRHVSHMNTHTKTQTRQVNIQGSLIHQPDQLETYLIRGLTQCQCQCECVWVGFCSLLTPLEWTSAHLQVYYTSLGFEGANKTHIQLTPPVQMCSH